MILLSLIWEFFKIGLFSIGGGYATIPFLHELVETQGWYSANELTNMIAISMLTPGPVGVNMATFAGFKTLGVLGGIVATIALVLPSYLIIIVVSRLLNYGDNFYVKSILYALKPAGCGLIFAVGVSLIKTHVTSVSALVLLTLLFVLSFWIKKNPLFYIAVAAVFAIVVKI